MHTLTFLDRATYARPKRKLPSKDGKRLIEREKTSTNQRKRKKPKKKSVINNKEYFFFVVKYRTYVVKVFSCLVYGAYVYTKWKNQYIIAS